MPPGRGDCERDVSQRLAARRQLRGEVSGLDLAAGHRPPQSSFACGAASKSQLDGDMAETIPDPNDGPEAILDREDRSKIIRKCLTKLSASHREIIDLVYYHEKSVDEVAGDRRGAEKHSQDTHVLRAQPHGEAASRPPACIAPSGPCAYPPNRHENAPNLECSRRLPQPGPGSVQRPRRGRTGSVKTARAAAPRGVRSTARRRGARPIARGLPI